MPDAPREPVRRRIVFSGTVQGVGFRYTTRSIAARFSISGFVCNLPDGTVELVVEGTTAELERFQSAVAKAMSGYIKSAEVAESAAIGEFHSFDIRH